MNKITEALTLPVHNVEGRQVDTVKLDAFIFDCAINKAAIQQAVNAYQANQRKGLASTKTRGEVSGGGRKPWKQKGTGRARVGSNRSPLWRHGGSTFGPHPRDYSYKLPTKIKELALRSVLTHKVKGNNFIILDEFKLDRPKTKDAAKILLNLKMDSKKSNAGSDSLVLLDKIEKNIKLALRNIDSIDFNLASDTHAYEVLAHKKLIITKPALSQLSKRLKK